MVKGVFEDTVELLTELQALGRADVRVDELLATRSGRWRKEAFPMLTVFDGEVVSGTEQTVKPDEKIYRILLDRYDLDAARTFYTDDKEYNVDAARAVGMDSEVFIGAADLRTHLRDRGLAL